MSAILADAGFPALKDLVIGITGMAFYRDKNHDLARIVATRWEACGARDCTAYVTRLREDPAEMEALVADLTIGETYFFRHREQFDALRDIILPDVIARNHQTRRLRIWSAGCATGPEPYSIAILLQQEFGEVIRDWHVSILGTDINQRFLARAREGVYDSWAFRAMPDHVLERCFSRRGSRWEINADYRRHVAFQYHNLITSTFPSVVDNIAGFDVIVCRNVIIYFDAETIGRLIPQFRDSLRDGGWLVMGHAEPNQELFSDFRTVNAQGAVLYQRVDGMAGRRPVEIAQPLFVPPTTLPVSVALPRPGRAVSPSVPAKRKPPPPPGRPTPPPQIHLPMPSAPAEHLLQVRHLADSGRWDEAAAACDRVLAEVPLDALAQFYRALIHEQVGQSEDCEKALRRAIYLDRKLVLPHYHLGLFLFRRDDAGAGKAFRNVLVLLDGVADDRSVAEGEAITAGHLREAVEMHLKLIGGAA